MRTRYFYLENGGNKVDLMDVGRIATLAVTLKPITDLNDNAFGYAAALHTYMKNNMDHLLFNSYTLLLCDNSGKELLNTNIKLCLLEKSFREDGASKTSIKDYVTVVNYYHRLLDENMLKYSSEDNKQSIKR